MIRAYAIGIAGTLALASPAAAGELLGTILSYHGPKRTIVLDDRSKYVVGEGVTVPLFRAGDKVRLTVEERGGNRTVTRMRVVN